jgi:hypothetical protein
MHRMVLANAVNTERRGISKIRIENFPGGLRVLENASTEVVGFKRAPYIPLTSARRAKYA